MMLETGPDGEGLEVWGALRAIRAGWVVHGTGRQ